MTEAAIIALAEMGREIAITVRVAIEKTDPAVQERMMEATKPLHELIVRINTAIGSIGAK